MMKLVKFAGLFLVLALAHRIVFFCLAIAAFFVTGGIIPVESTPLPVASQLRREQIRVYEDALAALLVPMVKTIAWPTTALREAGTKDPFAAAAGSSFWAALVMLVGVVTLKLRRILMSRKARTSNTFQ